VDLFQAAAEKDPTGVPLAARMRPRALDEVVGQRAVVGERGLLRRAVAAGRVPSLILWGPPGTGKTTLAEILSTAVDARFERVSAVLAGVKEIRAAIQRAERARFEGRAQTLLFVDEIHRFNKSQQDALLPHVEKGTVTLIGATTENPSFEVNAALLSRCRVVVLKAIDRADLEILLDRALTDPRGLDGACGIEEDARELLLDASAGDARRLLTALEVSGDLAIAEERDIALSDVELAVARRYVRFDKKGDAHYGVISAFIKSLRGSDPDASLHYLMRMLEAGEDPRFLLRRLVIFASEDIGNADPRALQVAVAAQQAFDFIGLPEGTHALAQATTFLACAPKSNATYEAWKAARKDLDRHGNAPLPAHVVNPATKLMERLGFGDGYKYPHDFPGSHVGQQYLPDELVGRVYYEPTTNGLERTIKERLDQWRDAQSAAAHDGEE
jgi:putative ATPase